MERKEINIDLPGVDRPAVVVIARAGQVHPAVGDDVQVRWQLWLPAYNDQFLSFDLCFLNRVGPVCGHILSSFWGDEYLVGRPGYVGRGGKVSARKWAEAWQAAQEYVLGEIKKLVDALEARQRALEEAEE